jgi:hypothetical protein
MKRSTRAAMMSSTSIETRSLPTLTRSYPRHFTFYVAHPIRSIPPLLVSKLISDALVR